MWSKLSSGRRCELQDAECKGVDARRTGMKPGESCVKCVKIHAYDRQSR